MDYYAEAASTARGLKFSWTLDFDDATDTITIECKQVSSDTGQPVAAQAGEMGGIEVTLADNSKRTFDFFTLGYVNAGPQVFPNTRLRINGTGRSKGFTLTTWFKPPPA